MPDDALDQVNGKCCKHLRCKEMFYDIGPSWEDRSGSGIFWCMHTQHCLGPDDAPATREKCCPGRGCYEE